MLMLKKFFDKMMVSVRPIDKENQYPFGPLNA